MKTVTNHKTNNASRDLSAEVMKQSIRTFIAMESAFEQCDDAVKQVMHDMIEIYRNDEASPTEKEMAISTICEALYPGQSVDDLQVFDDLVRTDADGRNADMILEELHFSEKLQALMTSRGMTQAQLAEATGVGQSAISNMVNRQCRPQRRTIAKIAAALGVEPSELWEDAM